MKIKRKSSHLSAARSGATAYASCAADLYKDSACIQSFSRTLNLKCHPDGAYTVK